jgi:hypothetical protein
MKAHVCQGMLGTNTNELRQAHVRCAKTYQQNSEKTGHQNGFLHTVTRSQLGIKMAQT